MRLPLLAAATVLSGALAVPAAVPAFADSAPPAAAVPHSAAAHRPGAAEHASWHKALDDLVTAGVPAVIAEVRDSHGVWTGTSGRGDLGHKRPLLADGRFRAGSETKSFVATTVLQLVAEKKVRLDAPIERYLPGLVPDGRHITVRQLLSHRSGLYNYTDSLWGGSLEQMYKTRFRIWTPKELLAEAFRHAPYFAPGTAGHYSNTNYIVLGMLIEKVTGNTPEHEITHRILGPLELHHTSFPGNSVRIPGPHAHGYIRMNGPGSPLTDVTEENMSAASTAGALISTTHDLNRFFSALIGGKLLPPALLRQMQDVKPLPDQSPYGLGLDRITDPAYGTAYGHTGGTLGYTTYSYTTADHSRQVTISLNTMVDSVQIKKAMDNALTTLLRPAATAK
ncbi:serine hydrolase domain-containing protein [Streptomyces sp. NPDC004533]|uniref:serine hydrolase domain-containing protein n=1 Tax=Streptomyces sp. NPDC004533 TaxID=3154278 RepID=UPI0033B7207A